VLSAEFQTAKSPAAKHPPHDPLGPCAVTSQLARALGGFGRWWVFAYH
jgi:hypothetical protein